MRKIREVIKNFKRDRSAVLTVYVTLGTLLYVALACLINPYILCYTLLAICAIAFVILFMLIIYFAVDCIMDEFNND